ncbi:MAG: L,D-transpeptidase family protein, partial [Paracoccaceae bacterium]
GWRLPVTIGRAGLVRQKEEGDGGTPVGSHRIIGLLYRPDRIARSRLPLWARPIGLGDCWCDDPAHPAYNQPVRAPFGGSHDRLRRAEPMYDLILLTDWNWPAAVPGRGSAIFLHRWRRPGAPTAGCIAMSGTDLLLLANRIEPGQRLIIRG